MKFARNSCAVVLGALVVVAAALPFSAFAAEPVGVRNAWARPTAPGQATAGAYMELESTTAAALVAVETPVAAKAVLHRMSMDSGVMRMRPVQKIDLPAGKSVKLAPGGLHIMLIELKRPLKEGDKVPLALTVQTPDGAKSKFKVEAEVRAASGGAEHRHH